jgi:hypothetical protein
MSVLDIAQNVAKETGFTAPSSLVGSTDELAIQLLALIKNETRALSDRFNWQALVKRATFNFVNGTESYSLATIASDFKDFIPETVWNYTSRRPLIAPISPQDYEIQKNYLITSGIDKMIYVYNDTIYISPTPSNTDTIYFEYTTLNIFKSSGGTPKAAITLDTDVTVLREFLVQAGVKLRFMVAKGLIMPGQIPQSFEYQDYESQVQKAMLTDGFGRKTLRMSGSVDAYWKAAYTQDSNFPSV